VASGCRSPAGENRVAEAIDRMRYLLGYVLQRYGSKGFKLHPDFLSFVKDLILDYLSIFFYITNFSEKMAGIVTGSGNGPGFFAVYRTVAIYGCSPKL